jgi:hypothetical protein
MIAAELAQRRLVQLKQDLAQLFGFGVAGSKTLPVNLTLREDERVSVFAADFAIPVAMAIVETCLAHAGSPLCPQPTASSRQAKMATNARSRNRAAWHHPGRLEVRAPVPAGGLFCQITSGLG